MRDAIARAIARADCVCLHLDPAYALAPDPVRTLVTQREALRIARLAESVGGVRLIHEGARLILAPPADRDPYAWGVLAQVSALLCAEAESTPAGVRAAFELVEDALAERRQLLDRREPIA